jgi:hypothetical protein
MTSHHQEPWRWRGELWQEKIDTEDCRVTGDMLSKAVGFGIFMDHSFLIAVSSYI